MRQRREIETGGQIIRLLCYIICLDMSPYSLNPMTVNEEFPAFMYLLVFPRNPVQRAPPDKGLFLMRFFERRCRFFLNIFAGTLATKSTGTCKMQNFPFRSVWLHFELLAQMDSKVYRIVAKKYIYTIYSLFTPYMCTDCMK